MLTDLKTIKLTCLILLTCISITILSAESCQNAIDLTDDFFLPTRSCLHDGFAAGTMIQTPLGCLPIEQLSIGDLISGKNQPQEILYLKKDIVDEYFVIQINQQLIKASAHQKFYLQSGELQTVDQLQVGDFLEIDPTAQNQNSSCVYDIYRVQEPCTMYCLSTQERSFYLYPDIHVHNFDVVTIGAMDFTLSLGIIEISNPITFVIGGVFILSWWAIQHFKHNAALDFDFDDEDPDLTAEHLSLHDHETVKQTRLYYLTKRQALIDAYQELIKLNSGILIALRPSINSSIAFAQHFLSPLQPKQYTQHMLPDLSYESNLSAAQKIQLLSARDIELEKLQREIMDLHLIIAFYTNEAIERRDFAKKEYDEIRKYIINEIHRWNYDLRNISTEIALDQYTAHFMWQDLLDNLEIKTKEIQFIFSYYQSLNDHFFITKSTNLASTIPDQIKINNSLFNLIKQTRAIWHSNMLNTEDFLRKHNLLSQELINQIKIPIQTNRSTKEKDAIALAKNKQNAARNAIKDCFSKNSPQPTPNIKGPDKDPDDWFEKLKKYAKRKALHHKFKKFYKDSQTDLWWSRDNGSAHAGPHYKVFQERATHLEWIRDVDLQGKIMQKHKGPIGKIIPYKELIFY